MTVEEFRNLKVGDMVEFNTLVYELKEIKTMIGGRNFIFDGCTPNFIIVERANKPYEIVYRNSSEVLDYLNGFNRFKKLSDRESFEFKYGVRMIRENALKYLIPEKETELENLKKEYEEIKRKNMLDRIVPGNVYRFTYNEESYVRLIREIYESKIYTTDLVRGYKDSFYIDGFKNVEHLPELTEAYKNFKTLLEKA
jgi:hypothetical protein